MSAAPHPRNVLLDALASVAGIPHAEMGKTVCARLNKQLTIIKESTPNVDLDEMRRRYRRHRALWPSIPVTPESLAKHWPECGEAKALAVIAGTGMHEPLGWRDHHAYIFPEEESGATGGYFARQPWDCIPRAYQERIIRKMKEIPTDNKIVNFNPRSA